MKKKSIRTFKKMKKDGDKITWITAYSYPTAWCAEQAGVDMILVGDSGGMVELGYETTNPVTMDEMIQMARAVRRGAPNTFIVGDMPQGSYEVSDELAVENALRFVKEAGCDAIKLEGGERVVSRVKAISNAGILVVGHLGLTPQSAASFGGYRVQGKTFNEYIEMRNEARALRDAGACMILIEATPETCGLGISTTSTIPILGIGAGAKTDGQLVILHDIVGFYPNFRPWFAKCYIPQVINKYGDLIAAQDDIKQFGIETRDDGMLAILKYAISEYVAEVRQGTFPSAEYTYPEKSDDHMNQIKDSLAMLSNGAGTNKFEEGGKI